MAKRRRARVRSGGLGEVTKQDFVAISKVLCRHGASEPLKRDLSDYFASQNPRFQADRFLAATRKC